MHYDDEPPQLELLDPAEEKLCMSRLLADGGFPVESLASLCEAMDMSLAAAASAAGIAVDDPVSLGQIGALQAHYALPDNTASMLRHEREGLVVIRSVPGLIICFHPAAGGGVWKCHSPARN